MQRSAADESGRLRPSTTVSIAAPVSHPAVVSPGRVRVWTGRVLTTLVTAFLRFDLSLKLLHQPMVVEGTAKIGCPESGILVTAVLLLPAVVLSAAGRLPSRRRLQMIAHTVNHFAHRQPADGGWIMKKVPEGWARVCPAVFYEDAARAIDWLCRAYGFEVQLKIEGEGGRIEHSELRFGEGLVMVSQAGGSSDRKTPLPTRSPRAVGGVNTQMLAIFVDDADAHCARARAAGGKVHEEPTTTDYGDDYWSDRTYRVEDPEGHHWWFIQRVRDPKPRGR